MKIDFSFEDEVNNKFCYRSDQNYIDLEFEEYYRDGVFIPTSCILIINNWNRLKVSYMDKINSNH